MKRHEHSPGGQPDEKKHKHSEHHNGESDLCAAISAIIVNGDNCCSSSLLVTQKCRSFLFQGDADLLQSANDRLDSRSNA